MLMRFALNLGIDSERGEKLAMLSLAMHEYHLDFNHPLQVALPQLMG